MTFGETMMYPYIVENYFDAEILNDVCPKMIGDLVWAEVRKDENAFPYKANFKFRGDDTGYSWDCSVKAGFADLDRFERRVLKSGDFVSASDSSLIGLVSLYIRYDEIQDVMPEDGQIVLRDGKSLYVDIEIMTWDMLRGLEREIKRREHERVCPGSGKQDPVSGKR